MATRFLGARFRADDGTTDKYTSIFTISDVIVLI